MNSYKRVSDVRLSSDLESDNTQRVERHWGFASVPYI